MQNWFSDYHHFQLLRLLSMAVVFGVLLPMLCVLIWVGSKLMAWIAREIRAVKPNIMSYRQH
jgi:uncharacterized membrane protein